VSVVLAARTVLVATIARPHLRAWRCLRSLGLLCALLLGAAGARAEGLAFVSAQRDGAGGVSGLNAPTAVAISPDGAHLYVPAATASAVVVFRRDPGTGALAFVQTVVDGAGGVDGIGGAIDAVVSPDGAHVYVAASQDHAVAVFRRNPASGALTFVEMHRDGMGGVDALAGPGSLAMSRDGAYLYVAASLDSAVSVFRRDPTSGVLTFLAAVRDDVGGVAGLGGAFAVALSPDDAYAYVTGPDDDAVALFERSPTTGLLQFVEAVTGGIASPVDVVVSPDGANAYVTGGLDTLAVFRRDAATGALEFLDAHHDDMDGVDGLGSPIGCTVSRDGRYVWVAGGMDDAVAVFRRDPQTGALTFVEAQRDGIDQVDGPFSGPVRMAVDPEDARVYLANAVGDAVLVFRRIVCGDGEVDRGEQCDDGNATGGDCCSAACAPEPAGAPCADANACTACDGAGGCAPRPDATPCDDQDACTADACAAGQCLATYPTLGALECALDQLAAIRCGDGFPGKLTRRIRARIRATKKALRRAFRRAARGKLRRVAKLRAKADRRLAGVAKLAADAVTARRARRRITADCRDVIGAAVQERRGVVAGFTF
jgi:cysteine-rich repeat protein